MRAIFSLSPREKAEVRASDRLVALQRKRRSMNNKTFHLPASQIRQLIPNMGVCFASDRIMVDGQKIGFMYREAPDNELDSGWRFLAGDESDEYMDKAENTGIYEVNTVANYDPDIIPYLQTPASCAFVKRRWLRGYKPVEPPPQE
jgi:hypothetical protein